ncbi:MAG: mannitol dehydrogenase family protein [Defluviitaleaceae bacterium]|nr:mannitol dehydrogenase family protein [Defluviitaleaceae bacterium]
MKLSRKSIQNQADWQGYILPGYDIDAMVEKTKKAPVWLHMGAGNIFRIFPAVMHQELLEAGLVDRGITVCECYDEEIVPSIFTPHDNLTLAVILKADGTTDKKVVASMAEAITASSQKERLMEIFSAPSLQMVSFTITEKGYKVADLLKRDSMIGYVVDGLLARYKAGAYPLSLVSMDNCAQNGTVLKGAIRSVAEAWVAEGWEAPGFVGYIDSLAFPWSMIDKITPRPSPEVAAMLKDTGYEDTAIITTAKGTWVSSFVIAEECQYLVIEDDFPNGRPPLEKAGLYFADRETVERSEKMKVCTCLNPLHTTLAISGCLLGYKTISETMQDPRLVTLIKRIAYVEGMPVVADPKIIDPKAFLRDVLEERFPNPFIGDTPQRIAVDVSQKIPVRFGETLKLRRKAGLPEAELEAIPFFAALWVRYLMGLNDNGEPTPVEPDPRAGELTAHLAGLHLGYMGDVMDKIAPILSDASIFGIDLCEGDGTLGRKAMAFFVELIEGPGAVGKALDKYWR